MKIKVNTSTMVKPMITKPNTTIWLSNLDLIMPINFHTPFLYFYRSTSAADFFDSTVLKAALSRALAEFYPVAGRLNKDDNGRIEINCNGEGALFVEAESDGTLDDLGDFRPRLDLHLVPEVDYSHGISTFPLFLVQVTRFKCGGVSLGVTISHLLVDGVCYSHFINTWANIAQGVDVTNPPFLDRHVLTARSPPQVQFTHAEYQPLKTPQDYPKSNSETIFSMFKLTRDQLITLKTNCQERDSYSTYEVVAGHAWRCVTKARGLPQDQETVLCIPVDGRARLRPVLPSGYFGNVVFGAMCIALCGEVESKPLRFVVRKIRAAIARMDDEYLRSAIDCLEVRGVGATAFECPSFGVNNWTKFPFYDANFGWGRPTYVGLSGYPPQWITIMLPSPTNDGSLMFAIVLPKEQMQVFQNLFYDDI